MNALLLACALLSPMPETAPPGLDYPLAPGSKWTYHIHHELGEGVQFGEQDAAKATGNELDFTVVAQAAATETIGGKQYTRVEATREGKPWMTEWYRLTPDGLFVGKTVEYDSHSTHVMDPEQKRLSAQLTPGESWIWDPKDAPLRFKTTVVATEPVDVPAGHYQATRLVMTGMIKVDAGMVQIFEQTWFAPGVGIVKQDTDTLAQGHLLTRVVMTLEKFEPAPAPAKTPR